MLDCGVYVRLIAVEQHRPQAVDYFEGVSNDPVAAPPTLLRIPVKPRVKKVLVHEDNHVVL